MSSDSTAGQPAVSVTAVSKEYRVYSKPHHRVLDSLAAKVGSSRSFSFRVRAVDNVSFTLDPGSSIAIIGRNGSGKSTLLEMITGTLEPTSGNITLNGRLSALLELGAGFNPDFTGRANYRLNASILGLDPDQIAEKEPEVEAFADLGGFMDEPVRTYSSGMYVRLAFATAVHVDPEILLIDEALAVGDVFFQQKCFDFFANRLAGVTKVLVTHDLASAAKIADRCIVMDQGRMVFDGEPLEAIQYYTALHLRERSSYRAAEAASAAPSLAEQASPSAGDTTLPQEAESNGEQDWPVAEPRPLPESSSSAPELVRMTTIAGTAIREGQRHPMNGQTWVAQPGDRLLVECTIEISVAIAAPIVGYLMRDRVGNAVFGQNSIGSGFPLEPLQPGQHRVVLEIPWPEVDAGEYVLTIGFGDGHHPHHHDLLAWVQGVAAITCTPQRPVHGMVNNDLTRVVVDKTG